MQTVPAGRVFVNGVAILLAGVLLIPGSPLQAADTKSSWAEEASRRASEPVLGLPKINHPEENQPTPGKIALGRKLFFDRRLSINRTMSCAMCHIPEQGFANWELQTAVGVEGRTVRRNAPTVLNAAFYRVLFVDGRDTSLETQYIAPLVARNEMANPSAGYVVELLRSLEDYRGAFEANFDGGPSLDRIGKALAAYQRSLIAGNSPFDRWLYQGDERALNASQKRGLGLFKGKAGCVSCHLIEETHAIFTDNAFHDIGYGWWREQQRQTPRDHQQVEVAPGVVYPVPHAVIASVSEKQQPDLGRYEVTQDPDDRWKFRTPSLRNVAVTPPYMHDGGFAQLKDVLRFYNEGGRAHDGLDPVIRPLELSDRDLRDLEAFLTALTSPDIPRLIEEARTAVPDNW
ncbi:cytochrome-c peroxidase [Pelagibius sp. Alg239-R121]|uniref:cytochrome-c peroxidase n=1 Tax=Pelagibius sp. Alg239-R121 TaxID=2993448 RepID=UPI0024A76D2F|nr:cytochrome c peroxidase [Pelagibius sp. Alg239-R121]